MAATETRPAPDWRLSAQQRNGVVSSDPLNRGGTVAAVDGWLRGVLDVSGPKPEPTAEPKPERGKGGGDGVGVVVWQREHVAVVQVDPA